MNTPRTDPVYLKGETSVVRRKVALQPGGWVRLVPEPNGEAVLFADVEEALHDKDRLEWLLPVLEGSDNSLVGDHRTLALAMGLTEGLKGRALVDWARQRSVS